MTFCRQVDKITVTKANCAARMSYFSSLLLTLLVFKAVVVTVLTLWWLIPTLKRRFNQFKKWRAVSHHVRTANVRRRSRSRRRST